MGKKRTIINKFNKLREMFPVVAVIGPRQCGKSTFVRDALPGWKYYDLERPDDYQLISQDPLSFFSLNTENIIIDEAQQYPELFKVLRGVIDSDRSVKGRFVLTGSSSPEIVKGLTESLAGRIATIEMAPFKVEEYLGVGPQFIYETLTHGKPSADDLLELKSSVGLKDVMKVWFQGGFPEPLLSEDEEYHRQWLENYIVSYLSRDIRALFPKLNIHNFRRFLTLLSQFSGHQINMSEIARSLEVGTPTVKDYLDIIHQTFIWRNLHPFEKNTLKKVQKSKRGFFRDQGLLHYFLKIKTLDDLIIHPVAGFSFESFVIEEIIRGFGATMATQTDFSYYRTIDKSEIDLIIDSPQGILPVEIKLGSVVKKKSLRALEKFIDEMKLPFGILVNNGARIQKLTDKVIQVPVNFF